MLRFLLSQDEIGVSRKLKKACSLLGGLGSGGLLGGSFLGSGFISSSWGLSFLHELREKFLVLGSSFSRGLGFVDLGLLDDLLSSDALLGDHSLDSWSLVVCLVSLGNGTVHNISTDIITFIEVEEWDDVVSSLLAESVVLLLVGDSSDLLLSLLDDGEGNDGKIWSTDASTDGLSRSLSSSGWLEKSSTYSWLD